MASSKSRITSIGRPVEPKYPTNLAILLVVGVVLVGATALALVDGDGIGTALLSGGHAGLLVFMVWAYGRETAPDDSPAAFVAVALAIAAWAYGLRPDVLPIAALMGGSRIVNRTVGPVPTLSDMIFVTGLAAWLTWDGHWQVGIAVGTAMLLDSVLKPRHLAAIPFSALLAFVTAATWRVAPPVFAAPTSMFEWIATGTAAVYAAVLAAQGPLRSRSDTTSEGLIPTRVQAGMAVALLAAVTIVCRGEEHLLAATGLFAVLAGTAVGRPRLWLGQGRAS